MHMKQLNGFISIPNVAEELLVDNDATVESKSFCVGLVGVIFGCGRTLYVKVIKTINDEILLMIIY